MDVTGNMGVRLLPKGKGMLATFLNAQESSPTLTLAHAKIGDEGAFEIAHFLATSRCLVSLDLTGNEISSTGVLHLAEALKQNLTLESLVLQHNRIGEDGEAGIGALCETLLGNSTLRHLDLRNNTLTGAPCMTCIGQMLQENRYLTHLELSWNPLGPAGAGVLAEHLRRNSTLLDCQLTGTGVAQETLVQIAELLHRNRIANKADMQAGPYRLTRSAGLERGGGGGIFLHRALEAAACEDIGIASPTLIPATNMIVSDQRTNDLLVRLQHWRAGAGVPPDSSARAQEMYEYLHNAMQSLQAEKTEIGRIRERVDLLVQGFQQRELRYRNDIAAAHDRIMDYSKEQEELRAVANRIGDTLNLEREVADQAKWDWDKDKKQMEAEESRMKNVLSTVMLEQNEQRERLHRLEEECAQKDRENAKLRERVERLRGDIIVLKP